MAVDRIVYEPWRDEQGPTRYPFADDASLTTAGGLVFPRAAAVDAVLHPAGAAGPVELLRVEADGRAVTLVLGDDTRAELATARVDPAAAPGVLAFRDPLGRPAGVLVLDPAGAVALKAWPAGRHEFPAGAARFCLTCWVPVPAGQVRAFVLDDGTVLAGEAWLVAEDGLVFREDGGEVRLDAVGDPLFRRRLCAPAELFVTPPAVRTINGVAPVNGAFTLTPGGLLAADNVVRVVPGPDGLEVSVVGRLTEGA